MKDKKKIVTLLVAIIVALICGVIAVIGIHNKTNSDGKTTTTESKQETSKKDYSETTEINADSINLNDYISVSFGGHNNEGSATVDFDKEQFLLDNTTHIAFNQDNLKTYRDLYGDDGKSAAYALCKFFSPQIARYEPLSNGDSIEIVWDFDKEKIETYFICNISCSPKKIIVDGLEELITKNIKKIWLPDFRGKIYDEIKNNEEYKDILVFKTEYIDSLEDKGVIVSQDLPEGVEVSSLNPRSITLRISNGKEVPDVIGLGLQDAISKLKETGFENIETECAKKAGSESESNNVYEVFYVDEKTNEKQAVPDDRRLSLQSIIILYYFSDYEDSM